MAAIHSKLSEQVNEIVCHNVIILLYYESLIIGVKMKKVIMTDKEQQFSDLKQLFTKIVKKNKIPDQAPRKYAEDAYEKKSRKRQADAAAVKTGTADIAQTKRHATVQACTARNHDAAFLVAAIASVEGIRSETLADPFFAPAVKAREVVEQELARRRVARVHEVRARHEEAIRKGVIV